MRTFFAAAYAIAPAVALLLLAGCSVVHRPTPPEQLAELLTAHPELARTDTVRVRDTLIVHVPTVRAVAVPVPRAEAINTRERAVVDSLLSVLTSRVDSAERYATKARLRYLLARGQRWPDTLRFADAGARGRVWRTASADGRLTYHVELKHDALRAGYERTRVSTTVTPPPLPRWYEKGWVWLLLVAVVVTADRLLPLRRA